MSAVGPKNARRLAMLVEDGSLRRMGRVEEVLGVVERHGDRALDFVWRHKGALAVGSVLAAFLNDPGPFLGGTRQLALCAIPGGGRAIAAFSDGVDVSRSWPAWWLFSALIGILVGGVAWRIARRLAGSR